MLNPANPGLCSTKFVSIFPNIMLAIITAILNMIDCLRVRYAMYLTLTTALPFKIASASTWDLRISKKRGTVPWVDSNRTIYSHFRQRDCNPVVFG